MLPTGPSHGIRKVVRVADAGLVVVCGEQRDAGENRTVKTCHSKLAHCCRVFRKNLLRDAIKADTSLVHQVGGDRIHPRKRSQAVLYRSGLAAAEIACPLAAKGIDCACICKEEFLDYLVMQTNVLVHVRIELIALELERL